jgi:hypothetical protein
MRVERSHEMEIVNKGVEQSSAARLPVPCPRIPITIRPGTMEDLPFIDALQKKHTKQVGFMPTKQFEGKIRAGHVLIAEERDEVEKRDEESERRRDEVKGKSDAPAHFVSPSLVTSRSPRTNLSVSTPLGYLIGTDQYFKHDDIGIIYQINIAESHRRSLVAATLLKAQFERSAYGCKLYCCWCAQDIEANRFWESMGFVPLAFRAGSAKKSRVHIFWQKRIREGDDTTPWWFPSQTTGGSIREDRLVLPIPPGTRWSDEMPRILPVARVSNPCLPGEKKQKCTGYKPVLQKTAKYAISRSRLHFAEATRADLPKEKPPREKRKAIKNDPKLIAAARELRDRWLERVNADPMALVASGKYEVTRLISDIEPTTAAAQITSKPIPILPAIAA